MMAEDRSYTGSPLKTKRESHTNVITTTIINFVEVYLVVEGPGDEG